MSMPQTPVRPRRVITYVDGFNLYFGLRDSGYQRYFWLDLMKLSVSLARPSDQVEAVKYFTALISGPPAKQRRQANYLEAMQEHLGGDLEIIHGRYQTENRMCQKCRATWPVSSEKKTDVNIAVEMMVDAFSDAFDSATVISADSDLVPPILAIRRLFPEKSIVVALPPGRHSFELRQAANASFTIGRAKFRDAQLPESVQKANGTVLRRPPEWG